MVKNENFILIFDISRKDGTLKRKINRKLHRIKAEKIQHSVWKSESLTDLVKVASEIKNNGGNVRVLKEDLIFY